jgi:hypothetical protein
LEHDQQQFQRCVEGLLIDNLQFGGLCLHQVLLHNKNNNFGKSAFAKCLPNLLVYAGRVQVVLFVVANDVVEFGVRPVILICGVLQILVFLFHVIIRVEDW